jgi:hypothetical protein
MSPTLRSNSFADLAADDTLTQADIAGDVDTKSEQFPTFGNDDVGGVDTKSRPLVNFGNDGIGFIRVRKRKLKGGHPSVRERIREWPGYYSERARESASFDLVRAVRVDGKPRHQFVLGLGSQKDRERQGLEWFWVRAIYRMAKHGLADDQRQRLIAEMVRKGARLPTLAKCEEHARIWPHDQSATNEIIQWLRGAAP